MLRTLAQHQLASNQALSPLHSRPRAPAAALLNAQAQEPPLVAAALCSAACEQRSARQTRGTPGRLWDGGPPSECEPHRRGYFPQDWSSLPAGTPSGGRVGLRLELARLDRAETPC